MEPLKGPRAWRAAPVSLDRRRFLAGGASLVAALGLPGGSARAQAPARSLLVVWLSGGPSQLETWDPHPGTKIGGPTRDLATRIPGLRIAAGYPRLAGRIDRLSVVRSLVSREADHGRATYQVKTGHRPQAGVQHPALGALLAHLLPSPELALPAHVSLLRSRWPAWGGDLGPEVDAFVVPEPGGAVANLEPEVAGPRFEQRLEALQVLDQQFAHAHPGGARAHAALDARAVSLMRSPELAAFLLDEEPAAIRAAYGDGDFGRACLVARRLIERGVRAVEVSLDGFDTHTDAFEGHAALAARLDPALSALLADLEARALLSRTVLLCMGELGRTPHINALEGRDHWVRGFSALIGGAGVRAGQLIGATDPRGERSEPEDPLPVEDLTATVLTCFGLDPESSLRAPSGRPTRLSPGRAVRRLLA